MPVDPGPVNKACDSRDIEALDTIVKHLEAPVPAITADESIPEAELEHALRMFKKRLKVMRLADESKLGGRQLTGGRKSEIDAIIPPSEFPPGKNRMAKWRAGLAGVVVLGLPACIPIQRTLAQSLDVQIVDAKTGMGVTGALVTLLPNEVYRGARPSQTTSGAGGEARIDAITKTEWIVPLPVDLFYSSAGVRVEAEGYATYEGPAHAGTTGWEPDPEAARVIALTPAGTD
jgi:hypothetical protein